jgi:WD40 repeat protein
MRQTFENECQDGPDILTKHVNQIDEWSLLVPLMVISTVRVELLHDLSIPSVGHGVDFDPEARLVVVASSTTELFDFSTGFELLVLREEHMGYLLNSKINALSFNPDSQHLAMRCIGGELQVCPQQLL